jgi:metal-responsive CopG/Arc/MetJ family transcriptional regulator
MSEMPTTPVNVRIESEALAKLEKMGQQVKPKALNRSEMINVAIAEYVERHGDKKSPSK